MLRVKLVGLYRAARAALCRLLRIKGYGISIIVPLHLSGIGEDERARNWKWLEKYWRTNLPGAEIIVGEDPGAGAGMPFSKSVAVNDAVEKAHGDILVVVDADVCVPVPSVMECVIEIRTARKKGYRLWFMPYRRVFRLSRAASTALIESGPKDGVWIDAPPHEGDFVNHGKYGGVPAVLVAHWFGAMVQIMPREAFELVGGWDPRFRGWGGEDRAAMQAMDAVYWPHKTIPGYVLHIWHPDTSASAESLNDPTVTRRLWNGQDESMTNGALSVRYFRAEGNRDKMKKILGEVKDRKAIVKPAMRGVPRGGSI